MKPDPKTSADIILLTHADTDLSMLFRAAEIMPEGFARVSGISLQSLQTAEQMSELLQTDLAAARIIVLRVLGRLSSVPAFLELAESVKTRSQHLLVISGTGELDPEMACVSNVPPAVLAEATAYFQSGGVSNTTQLLRFLSDHLLFTGFGYETPQALPEHGIYHPELHEAATIEDWQRIANPGQPTVAITFYRAHWMSGNTAFIDALVDELERQGINALPVFTSSLKAMPNDGCLPAALQFFQRNDKTWIDALINTTSFSMGDVNPSGPTLAGWSVDILSVLDLPVIQAITSNMTHSQWELSSRGLSPLDTAMNVVMPEFDGRIVTVPITFKPPRQAVESGQSVMASPDLVNYQPVPDRIKRVAQIAARLVRLRKLSNKDKRIAFVFTNSSSKASQIGNAVGLDAPASLYAILDSMRSAGYSIGELPERSDRLIHDLIDRCSYDQTYLSAEQCARAIGRIPAAKYSQWFSELPPLLQERINSQWGKPPGETYINDGHVLIAGLEYDNVVVVLQPPRGYGMDPNAIYHQPDLPPTHHYYGVYRWLRDDWKADAIVHVGKHGTLEWLPGKGVGLSANCFPDALLGDMPLFYPFIINDPGEGSQAKRRSHATIIDHLTPPMTSADTYGPLAQLVQLVDEYYQVEMLDPAKLPLLQQQIWDLVKKTHLDTDLSLVLKHELFEEHDHGAGDPHHEHDDHDHEHTDHDHELAGHHHEHDDHDHELAGHYHDHNDHDHDHEHTGEPLAPVELQGLPNALTKMGGFEVSHLIQEIDGYLCELGAASIRDGLHIFGQAPVADPLIDMLCSLTRLPNQNIPGLQSELARLYGYDLNDLLDGKGKRLDCASEHLNELAQRELFTNADVLETLDVLSVRLYSNLQQAAFDQMSIENVIQQTLRPEPQRDLTAIKQTLEFACTEIVSRLAKTDQELSNLIRGLDGRYVPAGPSGSPTRGMAHVLPTGRNFYSVDPRSLPSHSAWHVGQQLANEVVKRCLKESGKYPESVAISVWGTSAMRTHGDDVAEVLALLGVRPIWHEQNRQISGVEAINLSELGRPRIDVTIRISGFFRDAFPHLIGLIDQAVNTVALLDEPPEQNFIRKHYLEDLSKHKAQGLQEEDAVRRSLYRVFGAKPGSYGAGILPLIQERNWEDDADFAEAYINWGGYAYTQQESGKPALDEFRYRLSGVEIALHNQDNREHDIFDSDDYLQFHGGMIATIRSITGRSPRHYFGDSHDPGRPAVRDLKEETLRVFRSRVVNPKWLTSIQRHGYKGGLELTATVDYLFGYDATADVLDDWMYEQVAETYAMDPQINEFLSESNPWALNAIAERLLEAAGRKMWKEPAQETIDALRQIYLDSEAQLEARGEKPRKEEVSVS